MKNLAKKLVAIMKECGHVSKNGTNGFHNYKYATATDVLALVNNALTKYGVITAVESSLLDMREVTTAKGNSENLATVDVSVSFFDSDSGETLKIKGIGSGQDAGDKAVAKAQTMGIKYAYLTSFAIATGDDPEADIHTDEVMHGNKNSTQNSVQRYNATSQRMKNNPTVCSDCGAFVSQKVAEYSKAKFGKYLCYDCQHTQEQVA